MKVEKIRTDQINIGKRFRKQMGDLKALADDIKENGILRPIVVAKDGEFYRLICGHRTLLACRDHLHWAKIPAYLSDIEPGLASLKAELAENKMREPFTISEQVEIGKAIEELLGERRGQPRKESGQENPNTFGDAQKESGQEKPLKGRNREIAAESAGFGSGSSYENAKSVVANGTPELVEAMDSGVISKSDAAAVAKSPRKKQQAAVRAVKTGKSRTAKEAVTSSIQGDADEGEIEAIKDVDGKQVHNDAVPAFQAAKDIVSLCRKLDAISAELSELSKLPGWEMVNSESCKQSLKSVRQTIYQNRATHCCPYCHGEAKTCSSTTGCKGRRWTTKAFAEAAPK